MAGAAFFRIRSFAPLPIIFLAISQTWRSHVHPGPGGAEVDGVLNLVGLGLCVLGAAIRFATVGFVPDGTSSESRLLRSHALNTEGPYAVVRHPLYLGNLLITAGLLTIAHEPWAYLLGLSYFWLSHLLIVRAEEALLRRTFTTEYEAWAAQVPAWLPRLSGLKSRRGPFAWTRAIQREVNPFVGWGMGATLLLMWEFFARSQLSAAQQWRGLILLGVFLVLLILNKLWKKWWRA